MTRSFIVKSVKTVNFVNSILTVLITTLLCALSPCSGLFAAERRPLSGVVGGGLSGGEYSVTSVLTVPEGDTLRVGEGAVMYFEPLTGIDVRGALYAYGTPGNPIVMTSSNDAAGSAEAPQAFDWNGIRTFGPNAAVFMRHAVIGNGVYGVSIGDTLSKAELLEVVFKNNGYAPLVRGGEIVPVAADKPVNAAWNINVGTDAVAVKPVKKARKTDVKFIVNVSAAAVAAAGLTTCYIALSNTSVYYNHSVHDADADKFSEYYETKIRKNITVSAIGAVAAGIGLSCIGITLFF